MFSKSQNSPESGKAQNLTIEVIDERRVELNMAGVALRPFLSSLESKSAPHLSLVALVNDPENKSKSLVDDLVISARKEVDDARAA